MSESAGCLKNFSATATEWFEETFAEPTPPQVQGWPHISTGKHTLILAPTGSGKTLSAFFWGLDQLSSTPRPEEKNARTRILYISPLRALAVDVEKNLRVPLRGLKTVAERTGATFVEPQVAMRTGDTSQRERSQLARNPADLLITTPESLYLMLTSKVRETLAGVTTVIVDEIHALAATKRGAHLAVSLERLEAITANAPQRIGLSATQRPLLEIARFLGGSADGVARPVEIVDAGATKTLDLELIVPVDDMTDLDDSEDFSHQSIWPATHARLLALVMEHTSTILFVNSRRLAERLATRLNELYLEGLTKGAEAEGLSPEVGDEVVLAHHGSLSRTQRLDIENRLKAGSLKGLVATSSLELGIDMGAVDLVIQVESPHSVGRGLQRVGRAGHQVGAPSVGKFFPKHQADLLELSVLVGRMQTGSLEETQYPRNPLDVLAQQLVAACAVDDWSVTDLKKLVRSAANYETLSDDVFESVLDLLAGRYPSDEFSDLRPRLLWDRNKDMVSARSGAQRVAVINAGTIPDRGLFGVFLADGTRVGELDEEMVYESRVGERFLLGASTWRIEAITYERVVVSPAPGQPGKMPFWHGDGPGRPAELGRAVGEFTRNILSLPEDEAIACLVAEHCLSDVAAQNLLQYFVDQKEAAGYVPHDKTIVVERFRDEMGDWRVCILSPFGSQVHAPWGLAIQSRLSAQWDVVVEMQWGDDGIIFRLPEAFDTIPSELLAINPEEIEALLLSQLPSSALFAARFRECAGRALLLPRLHPGKRAPLWQQRQKAAGLLSVAAKYPTFPLLLETTRECLHDVFDVGSLQNILREIQGRHITVVSVDTQVPSPFSRSLVFGWIAQFMYEGDSPLAERRVAALSLDQKLLHDLLGSGSLRELLDLSVMQAVEAQLQRQDDRWKAKTIDQVADLLRHLGPLNYAELSERYVGEDSAQQCVSQLLEQGRVFEVTLYGSKKVIAAEDASRVRDVYSLDLPEGLPAVFVESVADPLGDLVSRFARTNLPFTTGIAAEKLGVSAEQVEIVLSRLVQEGRVVQGEFTPGVSGSEWCHAEVLDTVRKRSLVAFRKEVEPVSQASFVSFLEDWQFVGSTLRGVEGTSEVLSCLQGALLPASLVESHILPSRVQGYSSAYLDTLLTSGRLVWIGESALRAGDGRLRFFWRDALDCADLDCSVVPSGDIHHALLEHLRSAGASFWGELLVAVKDAGCVYDTASVLEALWDLVWTGLVTNDSFAAVRSFLSGGGQKKPVRRKKGRRVRPRFGGSSSVPAAGVGRWTAVSGLLGSSVPVTERVAKKALRLLDRYGVLTREMALGEGVAGGFAGVYPVLKEMEDRGQVRRGYFVEGLGAAQFALPGAVDRVREYRDKREGSPCVLLPAADSAQPYGAAIPWPAVDGKLSRDAGAFVLLKDGCLLAYCTRNGQSVHVSEQGFLDSSWVEVLVGAVQDRRLPRLEVRKVNGKPYAEVSAVKEMLLEQGFRQGYRGLTLG